MRHDKRSPNHQPPTSTLGTFWSQYNGKDQWMNIVRFPSTAHIDSNDWRPTVLIWIHQYIKMTSWFITLQQQICPEKPLVTLVEKEPTSLDAKLNVRCFISHPCRSRLDVNEASVRLGLDLIISIMIINSVQVTLGDLHDHYFTNTFAPNMSFLWSPLPTPVILWLLTLTSKSINILNIHEPWLQLTHSLKHHHPSGNLHPKPCPFLIKGAQHGKSFL